jgi:hypothetical protein
MMSPTPLDTPFGRRLLLAGAVVGTLVAAPATAAADGETTIRFGGAGARSLDGQKVTLSALRPAEARNAEKLSRARVSLPVAGGTVGSRAATVRHDGRVRLRAGKRSVTLTRFQVRLGGKSQRVTARLGGRTVTLLTLKTAKGRAATLDGGRRTARVSGAAASLPKSTAKRLRRALRLKRLPTGRLATVTVKADLSATAAKPAPAPPAPAPVPAPTSAPVPEPTMPVTPPVDPPPAPTPLVCDPLVSPAFGEGIEWTFKDSFLAYVQGPIAKGSVGCTDGATGSKTGSKVGFFRLGAATDVDFDPGDGTAAGATSTARGVTLDAAFGGAVAFRGHDYGNGPLLDMRLSNLRVELDGHGHGRLYADVDSREFGGMDPTAPAAPVTSHPDVHLADLAVTATPAESGGTRTWKDIATTLTSDGAEAFGGFYAAGEALAPISFAVPVTAPCPPLADTTFTDGAAWGVRASFRNYLQGPIAHGWIGCGAGASGFVNATTSRFELFRFSAPTSPRYDAAAGTLDATYGGRIRFRGHDYGNGPQLDLEFRNPRVVLDGTGGGELYVDAVSRPFGGMNPSAPAPPRESHAGVHLADLDLTGTTPTQANGQTVWTGVPATLSDDGATIAFAGFYGSGDSLDPITFSVPAAG